jgi:hypothetical protein
MDESQVEDNDDEDDEDMGEMPPKLPMPVGKMNCSVTRTCLARLIRFHCGRGQLPNYGNPASMPSWWPNHIIDWTKIKNLSHRYEGYLGNTYSNCLRIAMIRGYAHYGLDANEYVESKGIRAPYDPAFLNNGGCGVEAGAIFNNFNNGQINLPGTPVIQPVVLNSLKIKKPLPLLVPLSSMVSEGQYPQSLLDTRDWFPPRLAFSKAINAAPEAVKSLKPCKVIMDRSRANKSRKMVMGVAKEVDRVGNMFDYFYDDLRRQKFTDFSLVASKKTPNRPKEQSSLKVHRAILAAHSPRLCRILQVNISIYKFEFWLCILCLLLNQRA